MDHLNKELRDDKGSDSSPQEECPASVKASTLLRFPIAVRPKPCKDDAHNPAASRRRKSVPPIIARTKTDSTIPKQILDLRNQFLQLRKEIDRRRKDAGVKRAARNWNLDTTDKVELRELIDYIETELDRLGTELMDG